MATADDSGSSSYFGTSDPPVLEALTLPATPCEQEDLYAGVETPCRPAVLTCLCCYNTFEDKPLDPFLKHLALTHNLVIAEVKKIALFSRYITYWKNRFKENPLETFCSVIKTNSKDTDPGKSEYYYLLSDVLPEDHALRTKLQKETLETVLKQQKFERETSSFNRGCLFCREKFDRNRSDLFNHMTTEHSFNVGQPDNLVYCDQFLDLLESKLRSLECLYCEKTFKDRHVLKEHMRKKQHKKINPSNTLYDKFYIINYLECDKKWEEIRLEEDNVDDDNKDIDWNDWQDEEEEHTICLVCEFGSSEASAVMEHMKAEHTLDIEKIKQQMHLTFYQQVKLINYIRRQVHLHHCISCEETFKNNTELLRHMSDSKHLSSVPPQSVWDQPQYYFPTYENDNLLCTLEDEDDEDSSEAEILQTDPSCRKRSKSSELDLVIAEDLPFKDSVLKNADLLEELRT